MKKMQGCPEVGFGDGRKARLWQFKSASCIFTEYPAGSLLNEGGGGASGKPVRVKIPSREIFRCECTPIGKGRVSACGMRVQFPPSQAGCAAVSSAARASCSRGIRHPCSHDTAR